MRLQITINEPALREMDRRLSGRKRARSAFIRESVRLHLQRLRVQELEEQERQAYAREPVRRGEFDVFDPK